VCANCYWEGAGGGYDAYVALWYNAACASMSNLYELLGGRQKADYYRGLKSLADEAYRRMFWHTVTENGRTFSRFHGCRDWDGKTHDFGFTYYNIEAASRGIATDEQVRSMLWWLDRGQYSPDSGKTWLDHPYSIWDLFPPFNTLENSKWLQFCGTLPWLQVLTNGGNRLDCTARDLQLRGRYLSADNMHERNERILERFASPDRLTGGRTRNEHWIDRWFFLGPDTQLGDIEGFREIFPQGGIVASYQPLLYMGIDYTPTGLRIAPRVPSKLDSIEFSNFGYRGALLSLSAETIRKPVLAEKCTAKTTVSPGQELVREFSPGAAFSKVGLRIGMQGFQTRRDNQITITLYQIAGKKRTKLAENWLNHIEDGQWVWVDARRLLPKGCRYAVALSDAHLSGCDSMSVYCGLHGPALRVLEEKTLLRVEAIRDSSKGVFRLFPGRLVQDNVWEALLGPGESAMLTRPPRQRLFGCDPSTPMYQYLFSSPQTMTTSRTWPSQ
jgi:hypothetical protein